MSRTARERYPQAQKGLASLRLAESSCRDERNERLTAAAPMEE